MTVSDNTSITDILGKQLNVEDAVVYIWPDDAGFVDILSHKKQYTIHALKTNGVILDSGITMFIGEDPIDKSLKVAASRRATLLKVDDSAEFLATYLSIK